MPTRSRLNQENITNKALEIAEKEGMSAVTMANIARELEIKSPSLYNHFKGLDEIKQAMAIKTQKLLYEHLKETTKEKKKGLEMIKAIGKAYLSFAYQFPGLYEASLSAPDPSSPNAGFYGESIVELTQDSLSIYKLDQDDMIHTIRGLRSLLHGLVDLEKKGGFKLQVELQDSLEAILETFIRGIER